MENENPIMGKADIIELVNELIRVERQAAIEIYAQLQNYLKEKTFSQHPDQEIIIMLGLARFLIMEKDALKAHEVMCEAEKIALRHNLKGELLNIRSAFGITYSMRGDHLKAISLWEELLEQIDPSYDTWQAITNNLIIAYTNTKQFTQAVDLSYKLLNWLDQHNDPVGRISAYINLANAYGPLKQPDKAYQAYQEALSLSEKEENAYYMTFTLGNMAGTLVDLKRYDEALDTANRALELNKQHFSDALIADSYSSIGSIKNKLGQNEEALIYFQQALSLYDNVDDPSALANTHLSIGKLYLDMNCLEDSIRHLKTGYAISQQTDVNQLLQTSYKHLVEYYSRMEQYKEANEFYRLLTEFQDEQYEEITSTLISRLEAEYLRNKIEQQNTSYRLKNEELNKSNRLINKQSKQLKKTNQELTNTISVLKQLVSVISHDVRGPVMNTATITRLMLDGTFDEQTRAEIMRHIVDSLDGMGDLLTEILFWIESRNTNAGIGNLMRPVDITPLIESITKIYQSQILQKQINYRVEIIKAENVAFTEPNALKIVLRNIISNAIKFAPVGGKISVAFTETDSHLIIRITDNGIGMNQEEINHLLSHKLQSRQGTTQEFGMGMGLKLCLGYLKLLKAGLQIKSEPGTGSEFIITLNK